MATEGEKMTQIADYTGNTIKADGFESTISVEVGTASITSGTGAPTAPEPDGSIYLRTDGAAATTLYVRVGGAWLAATVA